MAVTISSTASPSVRLFSLTAMPMSQPGEVKAGSGPLRSVTRPAPAPCSPCSICARLASTASACPANTAATAADPVG